MAQRRQRFAAAHMHAEVGRNQGIGAGLPDVDQGHRLFGLRREPDQREGAEDLRRGSHHQESLRSAQRLLGLELHRGLQGAAKEDHPRLPDPPTGFAGRHHETVEAADVQVGIAVGADVHDLLWGEEGFHPRGVHFLKLQLVAGPRTSARAGQAHHLARLGDLGFIGASRASTQHQRKNKTRPSFADAKTVKQDLANPTSPCAWSLRPWRSITFRDPAL